MWDYPSESSVVSDRQIGREEPGPGSGDAELRHSILEAAVLGPGWSALQSAAGDGVDPETGTARSPLHLIQCGQPNGRSLGEKKKKENREQD